MAEDIKKILKQIQDFKKQIPQIMKKARHESDMEITRDLKKIAKQEIEGFYDSYHPKVYRRQYTLRNIYENGVRKNHDGDLVVDTDDPSLITGHHRVDDINSSYIHEYVFREGWHGGADINGNMLIPVSRYRPRELYSDENPPFDQVDMNGKRLWHWSPAKRSDIHPGKNIDKRVNDYYEDGDKILGKSCADVMIRHLYDNFDKYEIFRMAMGR